MPPAKTRFVCQQCGSQSPKWLGKCPDCGQWNSFVEEAREAPEARTRGRRLIGSDAKSRPEPLDRIETGRGVRLTTGWREFDRVLGGGVVPGETVMIGGDPGIGKSTLLLQVADRLAKAAGGTCLYVTGEESAQQVRLRADRLRAASSRVLVYPETEVDAILGHFQSLKPLLTVVDSVQTLFLPDLASAPGSVSQVRESAARLTYAAKRERLPLFLVGHVTKEGSIAGPMTLEHMVDAVLYLEGDAQKQYRILRSVKNRFGSTQEIGIFEMREDGMAEVEDASRAFLDPETPHAPGVAVTSSMEGTRPLLLEVQALVAGTNYGTPQRRCSGLDPNRLALLLAILEKRLGFSLSSQDVFLNLAGGLKVVEPAVDLAVALAVASSFREAPLPRDVAVVGEVGLSGEVRAVSQIGPRVSEAARLGFKRVVVPQGNLKGVSLDPDHPVDVLGISTLAEALAAVLPR